jgi:putative two-component system response regulator
MAQDGQDLTDAIILILDDEGPHRDAIKTAFITEGFSNLRLADSRSSATEFAEAETIDAVVYGVTNEHDLDTGESGRLLEFSEDATVRTPVVVVAREGVGLQMAALAAGAEDYLEHPFDSVEVVRRVAKLIELQQLYRTVCEENEILRRMVSEQMKQLQAARVAMLRSAAGDDLGLQSLLKALRMSQSCYILAGAMKLEPEFCEQVRLASPMQDIGSIAIPNRIFQKSGTLSHEEREIIKMHVLAGEEILAEQQGEVGAMARLIAKHHHERWDGSGYPEGLAGEAIPLVARIAAICDVFDALTTERPHKTAWPVEDAVHEIEKRAGSHFDPNIVPVFVGAVPAVLASGTRE